MLQTNCSNTVNRPRYLNSATPRHHRRAWAIEACLIASLPVTFAVGWSVREKWSVLARSSSTHPNDSQNKNAYIQISKMHFLNINIGVLMSDKIIF